MSYKLFIPGPIAVSEKTLRAMTRPIIGHRSSDFVALYQAIQPKLQSLFFTKDPVYLSTSSAWGVMEGAVRNLCRRKVLNCMNGAFSDKWNDVALRCGRAAGLRPADCLADNDGHGFFEALGDSVVTGPTLTNVNDFRAILIDAP
jgi:aspartate aminotransferase-like enzyme